MKRLMIEKLLNLYPFVPNSMLDRLTLTGVSGAEVHLCLHRVGFPVFKRCPIADTSVMPDELDFLLDTLRSKTRTARPAKIVASFDDGYADAVSYVQSRYERFPDVEWMFFICPRKLRDRSGFRWDAADPAAEQSQPLLIALENQRSTLRGLADVPLHQLATVEQIKRIAALPRVTLGNHTNCHFALSEISIEDCRTELWQSRREFEELFGSSEHFAFPYGVPGLHFRKDHQELVAAEGYRYLYTVQPRPVHRLEGGRYQLISRFAVMGTWPMKKYALLIALICLRERIRKIHQTNRETPS
jgi:hypothetical protein